LIDALTLTASQQESGAPSSSDTGGPSFDEEIAWILAPFSESATEADNTADNAADLAFLETIIAGFKDVQDRYSKRWIKLQEEHKALGLAEEKLKEKAEEIYTWYNGQSHNLRKQEEKLAAA
jgi:hypothetical protein